MTDTACAWVALGTNLGAREEHLAWARERLAALPGTTMLGASSVEETAPLGDIPQPHFGHGSLTLPRSFAQCRRRRSGSAR